MDSPGTAVLTGTHELLLIDALAYHPSTFTRSIYTEKGKSPDG